MQSITIKTISAAREFAFINKRSPRTSDVEAIAVKRVRYTATVRVCASSKGNPARRVYRPTERSLDNHGDMLLLPE
jgi:hypothetical protein